MTEPDDLDPRDRLAATIYDTVAWRNVDYPVALDVADKLIAESGWDMLMALLDAHYPASIFPTADDNPERDPGPRIVSLLRRINEIREIER